MNLPSNTIMIIAAVFGVSFLLMIPAFIFSSKQKNKTNDFIAQHQGKALLTVAGSNVTVNGVDLKQLEYVRDPALNYLIALEPGVPHSVSAKYSITKAGLTGNKTYSMSEPAELSVMLEPNTKYDMTLTFEDPDSDCINYAELRGSWGKQIFLVCYKSKKQ